MHDTQPERGWEQHALESHARGLPGARQPRKSAGPAQAQRRESKKLVEGAEDNNVAVVCKSHCEQLFVVELERPKSHKKPCHDCLCSSI